jgi:hypothetical protein
LPFFPDVWTVGVTVYFDRPCRTGRLLELAKLRQNSNCT